VRAFLPSLVAVFALGSTAFAETITVREGDSLWDLARAHGTTVTALMNANGLTEPLIRVGDHLTLPGTQPTVVPASTTWTVAPGDTLSDVALQTGVPVERLMSLNGLTGTTIRVGDVLTVRPADGDSNDVRQPLVVEVRVGDSLWDIAMAHDVALEELLRVNGLEQSSIIRPGDALQIPGRFVTAGRPVDQGGFATPTITVDPGDTLWDIANRYNTSIEALMSANNLRNATLSVGQTLRIVDANGSAQGVRAAVAPTPAGAARMVWPLRGAITSGFGWRSITIGGSNAHYGVDIDGVTGDPIVSATAGTVTYAGWMGGFGQVVVVEQGNREYYYAHASQLHVQEGQRVTPGQLIARVGATGRVTGSHLHFEVRIDGTPVDPMPILKAQAGDP
jgi:murein DD-endopeptidase MepM/ murein hydrolase activator NlpD